MNADGTKQTRLTVNSADDSHPVWSPDGTRIAFDSDRDRNSEIYVMNADGTKQTRLTNNGAPNFEPAWSPDSKKIAFSSGKMEGNIWIYKIDSDGTNETRLTNNKQDVSPWWSPDGKKLAFYSLQEGERVPYDLYTMDADGSNQIDVFSHLEWYYYEPAWSPIK
jgi:Tol biopolymer transport system component